RDRVADRPKHLRPVEMGRLVTGVRLLASFVRRLLVLMALSFEHGLVDRIDPAGMPPRPDGKPRGRKKAPGVRFVILEPRASTIETVAETVHRFSWDDWRADAPCGPRQPPSPARLYRMLDLLAAIVADPEPRARKLAFHLARTRHGPILPPVGPRRIAGRWGTEVRAGHEAIAGAIMNASRERPPPLAPPRRGLPAVTGL
ncbi:MAG: hypothetical protein MUF14_08310, partial [Hyphomonadaceae bacterium]|nr:hypothetical protein [Hyphomonadaceae bacterium]